MVELARLGPALRLLRQYRRMRQNEMARRAGITRSMASAYECGSRLPSVRSLVSVLNALNADFGTLHRALEEAERRS